MTIKIMNMRLISTFTASLIFLTACATAHQQTKAEPPGAGVAATPLRLSNLHEGFTDDTPYFARRSDALDAKAREALSRNVRLILRYNIRFEIVGHADACDDEATNQRLSERRAENVRQELLALGVPANLIVSVSGMGSERPLARAPPCSSRFQDRVELNMIDMQPSD